MANSANVFTFVFSAKEIKKVFPESDLSHLLVKVDLDPKEIGGKKYPVITASLEGHKKSTGKPTVTGPLTMDGCPIPPCTPPTGGGGGNH